MNYMNYRDFFKKQGRLDTDIKLLIPEGVALKEFYKGLEIEKDSTGDEMMAAKIAGDNLSQDPEYYTKIHGDDYDENGGLPLLGGALAVPHVGQPIRFGKIVQVGNEFGHGSANGELSGMTCPGVKVSQGEGSKETITAGGKKVDSSVVSRSTGGEVVPGEGQKQGLGLNSKGHIAGTSKLNENKQKVRSIVKQVLKEIKFDSKKGKWVKLTENKSTEDCDVCGLPPDECTCIDESLDMKMGKSYKTVQPRLYKVSDDDFARTNQYEPEISEMMDDEEECIMNERYVSLVNAGHNLTESELNELKTLSEKIQSLQEKNFLKKAINPDHKGFCTPMSKPTCTPHRKALAKRFKSGDLHKENDEYGDEPERREYDRQISKYNKSNKQRFPCPTCNTPNALSAWEKQKGYQCNSCADREEGVMQENEVNMKMGASYKTVQQTLAKTANDDFARRNQYEPQVSENEIEDKFQFKNGDKVRFTNQYGGGKNSEVFTLNQWDGKNGRVSDKNGRGWNVKGYQLIPVEHDEYDHNNDEPSNTTELEEAGGQSVQHRSYRISSDLPQNPKARWSDEVYQEGKLSQVARTIKKGMKPKKTKRVSK